MYPISTFFSHRCGGLAHTLPLSTCHYVTIAFAPPSCLPWLIVALALIALFLLRRCRSTRSLHLLPPICLLFSLAGCFVPSHWWQRRSRKGQSAVSRRHRRFPLVHCCHCRCCTSRVLLTAPRRHRCPRMKKGWPMLPRHLVIIARAGGN